MTKGLEFEIIKSIANFKKEDEEPEKILMANDCFLRLERKGVIIKHNDDYSYQGVDIKITEKINAEFIVL